MSSTCTGCGKPITDTVIRVGGGEYHKPCFQCTQCGEPFAVTGNRDVIVDDGKFKCGDCYNEKPKCRGCWKAITDGMIVHAFGRNFHKQCLPCVLRLQEDFAWVCGSEKIEFGAESFGQCECCGSCCKYWDLRLVKTDVDSSNVSLGECAICKTAVEQGGVNAPHFGFVHQECFKCQDCKKPFGEETPGSFSGRMICQDCYTVRREAMADPCGACGKPITCGPKLVMNQKYHPTCVRCYKCNKDMTWEGKNLAADGKKLVCDGCK